MQHRIYHLLNFKSASAPAILYSHLLPERFLIPRGPRTPQHSPALPPMATVNHSSDSVNLDLPIWDISYKQNHTLVKKT